MGRSAGQSARVAGSDRPSAAGRARPALAPKAPLTPAAPKVENLKTVREILPPWEVLQQQMEQRKAVADATSIAPEAGAKNALAEQEAKNALWAPPPPSKSTPPSGRPRARAGSEDSVIPVSGVRMSDAAPEPIESVMSHSAYYAAAAAQLADERLSREGLEPEHVGHGEIIEDGLAHDLSFKVYTLAELERRSDAPVSMRGSRASVDLTSSRSGPQRNWGRAAAALLAFFSASVAWLRIKGMRPNLKVTLRPQFDVLGDELQLIVDSIDWRTIGVRTGIVVGASLTLLFAVLTAAELTDDLKSPGSGSHLASSETSVPSGRTPLDTHGVAPATNMAAQGSQLVAAPVPVAPAAAQPDATSAGELDDEPAAPAKKPAKKAAAKKAPAKLGFRNADAIFQK